MQVRDKSKRKEYVPKPETVRVLSVNMQNEIQGRDGIISQTKRKCIAVADT